MNNEKSKAYKNLVKAMQEKYPKYDENGDSELYAPYVNGKMLCKEINLYTYWQGLNYILKTPKIKYLFVAQDFGSIFENNELMRRFLNRIEKINEGFYKVPYFDSENNFSMTDSNLIKMFDKFGYDITKRHLKLFFTNFCLGYRKNREVKMTKELMMSDAPLFKDLCEILEPENIICMGRLTFECVYETLAGKPNEELEKFKYWNTFLEKHKPITLRLKGNPVPIIPVAHCGKNGIENRNSNDTELSKQYRDWIDIKKSIKEYEYKTVDDALKSKQSSFKEFLFKLIDERNLTDAQVYNKVHLNRKIFSDIRRKSNHSPTKETIIAIIFSLELSMEDALELLSRTGHTLSSSDDADLIVTHFIATRNFNYDEFNNELMRRGMKTIFSVKGENDK